MEKLKAYIKKSSFCLSIFYYILKIIKHDEYLSIVSCFNEFKKENVSKDACCRDIFIATYKYRIIPKEYFLFSFEKRSEKERKEFIGYKERYQICKPKTEEVLLKFSDKYRTYEILKPYYCREIIKIENEKDKELFLQFCQNHSLFMIKVLRGYKGQGISKIELSDRLDKEDLFKSILEKGPCVLEECIKQDQTMAVFHPHSVNSIRFVTMNNESNQPKPLFAVIRMGQGGSVVDNAGAGGVVAAVDIADGQIISEGCRENGERHEIHPTTKVKIKGNQVPCWEELVQLALETAKHIPEQKIIGWDFALTPKGWVIIEANQSPSFTGIQMTTQKGIRNLIY